MSRTALPCIPRGWPAVFIGLAVLSVSACRSAGEASKGPSGPLPVWTELRAQAGSALDERPFDTLDPEADLEGGFVVRMTAWSLAGARLTDHRFDPIAVQARLIVSMHHDRSVLPAPHLTRSVELMTGMPARALFDELRKVEADSVWTLGEWTEGVPGSTTLELAMRPPGRLGQPIGRFERVGVTISAEPEGSALMGRLGVIVEREMPLPDFRMGGGAAGRPDSDEASTQPEAVRQRELVLLLDDLAPGGDPVLVAFPGAFSNSETLLLALERLPQSEVEAQPDALDFARARLASRATATGLAVDANALLVWQALRESLAWPDRQRESLAYLSQTTGAAFAQDVALIAPDGVLEDIAARLRQLPPGRLQSATAELGWELEQAAFAVVRDRMDTPEWRAEYRAVLVRRFGACGRDLPVIGDLIDESTSLIDLGNHIEVENWSRLESSSPADRTRAFDWLHRRGRAPAGYDPLGDRKERRAALRAAFLATGQQEEGAKQ